MTCPMKTREQQDAVFDGIKEWRREAAQLEAQVAEITQEHLAEQPPTEA